MIVQFGTKIKWTEKNPIFLKEKKKKKLTLGKEVEGGGREAGDSSVPIRVFCTEVGEQSLKITSWRSAMRSRFIFKGERSGEDARSSALYLLLKYD